MEAGFDIPETERESAISEIGAIFMPYRSMVALRDGLERVAGSLGPVCQLPVAPPPFLFDISVGGFQAVSRKSCMSSEIVTLKDGQPVTTSLIVAEVFGKQHGHVLRDIDSIVASKPYQSRIGNGTKSNFGFCYQTNKLANNKPLRYCEMDRQGFEILAMGFTGEKAMEWKLKYSDAFAFMESELRRQSAAALPNFDDPIVAAEAWIAERKMKLLAERELEASRPKIAFHDQVVSSETLIDFPQMFSLLQRKTGQNFNRSTFLFFARRHGVACQPNPHSGIDKNRFVPRKDYVGTWFVSELHGDGVTEWMVRPIAIAAIVAMIEIDRNQPSLQ